MECVLWRCGKFTESLERVECVPGTRYSTLAVPQTKEPSSAQAPPPQQPAGQTTGTLRGARKRRAKNGSHGSNGSNGFSSKNFKEKQSKKKSRNGSNKDYNKHATKAKCAVVVKSKQQQDYEAKEAVKMVVP